MKLIYIVYTVSRKVMVESVGVSTFSSRDASTQTLVDAETQTEESTVRTRLLANMRLCVNSAYNERYGMY